jgi:hypothetical protein
VLPPFSPGVSLPPQGACRELSLQSTSYAERKGDWLRFVVPLNAFDWRAPSWDSNRAFGGCSDQLGAWDVSNIQLKNGRSWDQSICLADVSIY